MILIKFILFLFCGIHGALCPFDIEYLNDIVEEEEDEEAYDFVNFAKSVKNLLISIQQSYDNDKRLIEEEKEKWEKLQASKLKEFELNKIERDRSYKKIKPNGIISTFIQNIARCFNIHRRDSEFMEEEQAEIKLENECFKLLKGNYEKNLYNLHQKLKGREENFDAVIKESLLAVIRKTLSQLSNLENLPNQKRKIVIRSMKQLCFGGYSPEELLSFMDLVQKFHEDDDKRVRLAAAIAMIQIVESWNFINNRKQHSYHDFTHFEHKMIYFISCVIEEDDNVTRMNMVDLLNQSQLECVLAHDSFFDLITNFTDDKLKRIRVLSLNLIDRLFLYNPDHWYKEQRPFAIVNQTGGGADRGIDNSNFEKNESELPANCPFCGGDIQMGSVPRHMNRVCRKWRQIFPKYKATSMVLEGIINNKYPTFDECQEYAENLCHNNGIEIDTSFNDFEVYALAVTNYNILKETLLECGGSVENAKLVPFFESIAPCAHM